MTNNKPNIILNTSSRICCMLKLTNFTYNNKILNLVEMGFEKNKIIIIINILRMEVHQRINTQDIVYSLAQFKNDSKYLICSLSDGKMLIFLLKGNKYEKLQILVKPEHLQKGEINKVITLSDGNLVIAERGAISIWKSLLIKRKNKFEFSKEIITENDTCQLLEVKHRF